MSNQPVPLRAPPNGEAFSLSDSSRLSLPEKAVQVWVLNDSLIEQACSALVHTLSQDERQRAYAYKQERHRNRFIARRGLLRWLVGRYLACKPESVRFGFTPFGKPALQWPVAPRLAFSISQTDGMALLAFAWDCSIGVDAEQRADGVNITAVGRQIFSLVEEKALDTAKTDPVTVFFRIWTRKEALLKALGTGLSHQPKSYSTENDLQHGKNRWCASHNGKPMIGWTCLDLVLSPKVRGALAVSLQDAQVSLTLCSLSTTGITPLS